MGSCLRSGQILDYKICIRYFFNYHVSLKNKIKDWLAGNQENVSEWSDTSVRGLLFQRASTMKIQLSMLVLIQSGYHTHSCVSLSWPGVVDTTLRDKVYQ